MKQEKIFREYISEKKRKIRIAKDEYKLTIIGGLFGRGKTALLAYFAWKNQEKYDIICANFHLRLKKFQFVEKFDENFLLGLNRRKKYMILVDEAYRYLDRRSCMKKENKKLSSAFFQIRKLQSEIYCTIPNLLYLDFRVLESANFFLQALGKIEGSGEKFLYSTVDIISSPAYRQFGIRYGEKYIIDMGEIFHRRIYNTMERVRT